MGITQLQEAGIKRSCSGGGPGIHLGLALIKKQRLSENHWNPDTFLTTDK